jgi:hypothetical protein
LGSGHGGLAQLTVVGRLSFCWWEVADLAVEPALVEPVDVGEGGQLNLLEGAPGAWRRISSVLYSPMVDSARLLS